MGATDDLWIVWEKKMFSEESIENHAALTEPNPGWA